MKSKITLKLLALVIFSSVISKPASSQTSTLADNLVILNSATPNDLQAPDVLLKENAFIIDGIPYDVTLTILQKNRTGGGSLRLTETNPGSWNLQLRTVRQERNPSVLYNVKIVEHGSATSSNPAGNPVAISNLKMYLPDIDGAADLFSGSTNPDRMYVDIAGYRVTGGIPPEVTVNSNYLFQQDFYPNPTLGELSITNTSGFVKYRPNVSTRDYSDNTLTSASALNYAVSRYAINLDFTEFPATGIDLVFGVTSDPGQQSATPESTSRSFFHVFTVTENTTPLPVSLLNFNIVKQSGKVLLNWATASEQNNKGFAIERCNDGKNWNNIGWVNSKSTNDNSSFRIEYSFEDDGVLKGKQMYRLKQTDFNGSYTYSPVKTIIFNPERNVAIFPNPVHNSLIISGLQGNEQISLYDRTGRLLSTEQATEFRMNIKTSNLSPGIYYVNIIGADGTVSSHNIIKTN